MSDFIFMLFGISLVYDTFCPDGMWPTAPKGGDDTPLPPSPAHIPYNDFPVFWIRAAHPRHEYPFRTVIGAVMEPPAGYSPSIFCNRIRSGQRFLYRLPVLGHAYWMGFCVIPITFLVEKHLAVQKRIENVPVRQFAHRPRLSHGGLK
jgi:hypothetical protein